jgi:site-specific DNA-methyltransferase (adenine-specific)
MCLFNADCKEKLQQLDDNIFDSLITDPPAGISFMGKEWDKDKGGRDQWIEWLTEIMKECHRVLKPGAHGFVWAIPRTSHWTATALENAGFEIRDVVTHLFGSGFPKSLNISKAIDKAAGQEREIIGENKYNTKRKNGASKNRATDVARTIGVSQDTAPSTDSAKQWDGWGTALKPASEHWILIRKPLSEKTVAKNVLKWGTGGINIDGCRIGSGDDRTDGGLNSKKFNTKTGSLNFRVNQSVRPTGGRFPANLVLSGDAPEMLDEQSGPCKLGGAQKGSQYKNTIKFWDNRVGKVTGHGYITNELYGPSRFFYCAKASKSERNAGLEGMPKKYNDFQRKSSGLSKSIKGRQGLPDNSGQPKENHHPTVKPLKLMQYLCRMITPPKGIVLDPFMGSGSTCLAAQQEGFKYFGIELDREYYEIAKKRIKGVNKQCILI